VYEGSSIIEFYVFRDEDLQDDPVNLEVVEATF